MELTHIGFGTMNGKDGKPFKTRDGGVMRLEYLLDEINEEMLKKRLQRTRKKKENLDISEEEAKKNRLQKRLLWQQSNTEIFPTRQARTTVLILSVLLLFEGIQVRIFSIRSFVLNPF